MSKNEIISIEQNLPEQLLLMPLSGNPIFPGIFTPIMISQKEDIKLIEKAEENGNFIGMILAKNKNSAKKSKRNSANSSEDFVKEELYEVGTIAKIVKKIRLPDNSINIFVNTIKRFRIKELLSQETPIISKVEYLEDIVDDDEKVIKALTRALVSEMKQISENNPIFTEEMRLNMVNIDYPGKIADFITSILNLDRDDQQKILEELKLHKRMEKVLIYIKKEQDLLKIQRKVTYQINEKIEQSQREYFLREEIKAIKKELGEPSDSRSNDHLKFKKEIEKLKLTGEVKERLEQELEKFSLLDSHSPEFTVSRNYLDTIISLPWETAKPDKIDIKKSRDKLEKDHYGLEEVKERILEYLAVRKLKEDNRGSIICLLGPPGVGKTSIAKSISKCLNRKIYRFSVGGMRDEAEIKGHRRTYIGSMPGKIIQGLKVTKTKAPVFVIDEIDKMGNSYQGDPSSALLEVMDPEQNTEFRDHYLDLPFDLSQILFIATANSTDSIPRALLDRMEVIQLSGYITEEKVQIAKKYIIPRSLEKHGIKAKQVKYSLKTLRAIADKYAREAGVRNYEKILDRIHRKLAYKISLDEHGPFEIRENNLEEYLKKPIFSNDNLKKATKPGLVVGLAWTSMGGDTLLIEAISLAGKGNIQLTGQMGDVMKESASIAFSHVKSIASTLNIAAKFFTANNVHLHIPEGATPKDGPSAGITMATALVSLALNKKIKNNFAMTGELSLTGQVLPIGGLKEKTIAARRNKLKHIIIPKQNERDIEDIPEHVRNGISYHPVSSFAEVVELIF